MNQIKNIRRLCTTTVNNKVGMHGRNLSLISRKTFQSTTLNYRTRRSIVCIHGGITNKNRSTVGHFFGKLSPTVAQNRQHLSSYSFLILSCGILELGINNDMAIALKYGFSICKSAFLSFKYLQLTSRRNSANAY